jgi:type III secretion protein J
MRTAVILALALAGCAREELVHGLDEAQANQVVVALDEGGVRADKRREDGTDATWRVEVAPGDAARAQRLLAERELPRPRPPGFAEVFAKGSVVPTPSEERALYLHALTGELARTVEAIDGVVEARVHLALPIEDALRLQPQPPPHAAVLVKARPGACERVEALAPGMQAIVAGAVPGLAAPNVSVVVAEAAAAPRAPSGEDGHRRALLLAAAAVAAATALALGGAGLRERLRSTAWARRRGEDAP